VKIYLQNKIKLNIIGLSIVLIVLLIPNVDFAQSPDLGTASSFSLFTAVGQFSNIGATSVVGDIGTDVGAFAGFPPGTIGQIHVADTASSQAAIDVHVAYSFLSSIRCDSVIGTSLGNGQILAPNVYCMGAASTLNGTLTLDAQGNANAIFIFQIGGAFTANTLSNIVLINSASSYNIYWQINGEFDLGSSSNFSGTIIANGGINLLNGSSLEGRALSIAGGISLDDNTVSIPTQLIPLPIRLLSFEANEVNRNIELLWTTASEINNNYFSIEHSQDAIHFIGILRISGAGNSNTKLYYSAIDSNPYNGISYYRLKQIDVDGNYTYSNIIAADIDKPFAFTIYPNPFSAPSFITIDGIGKTGDHKLLIYDIWGGIITSIHLTKQSTILETSTLPSGIYFYSLFDNDRIIQSGKLVSE
jgi:hypothetical protein